MPQSFVPDCPCSVVFGRPEGDGVYVAEYCPCTVPTAANAASIVDAAKRRYGELLIVGDVVALIWDKRFNKVAEGIVKLEEEERRKKRRVKKKGKEQREKGAKVCGSKDVVRRRK